MKKNTVKTYTLTEFIKTLTKVKKELADKGVTDASVMLSSDSEGNSFGTIGDMSFGFDEDTKIMTIYPMEEIWSDDIYGD